VGDQLSADSGTNPGTDPGTDPVHPEPGRWCGICGELSDEEWARQKWGWPENNTFLPAAAHHPIVVRDFDPYASRKRQLQQCPGCGGYFLYQTDYEYLANGSEDEEHLTRLTDEEAAGCLDRPGQVQA